MNAPSIFFSAMRPFQAARRLSSLGSACAFHGHGFEARLVAPQADCRGRFQGDEVRALQTMLEPPVAALDYRSINERIEEPDDVRLAEWLLSETGLAEKAGLALRSAPDRGAIIEPEGRQLAWRRFRFESAHCLPNVPAVHKCGRMHGHGFEVTLFAALEPREDATDVQASIARAWQPLQTRLHLACLNDLPGLENPTSEVLAQWIWRALGDSLPGLAGVTVMETASAGCHFDGERWRIWKSMSFDSAVRLARAPADDARRMIHGHTFTVRLHLSGNLERVIGWVQDYGDVKRRFDPLFRTLDHQPLYEHPELADSDDASIAGLIESKMAAELPALCRVDVLQAPGCGAVLLRGGGPREALEP